MSFSKIQQSQGFSLHSSGAAKLISASARLLFVCAFIFFLICPLKKPQGNQPYIITGNTLSAFTFCSWHLYLCQGKASFLSESSILGEHQICLQLQYDTAIFQLPRQIVFVFSQMAIYVFFMKYDQRNLDCCLF